MDIRTIVLLFLENSLGWYHKQDNAYTDCTGIWGKTLWWARAIRNERERVREKKLKILFHYNNKKFENGNLKSNIHLFKSFKLTNTSKTKKKWYIQKLNLKPVTTDERKATLGMVVVGSLRRLGNPVSEIRVQWLSEQWDLEKNLIKRFQVKRKGLRERLREITCFWRDWEKAKTFSGAIQSSWRLRT